MRTDTLSGVEHIYGIEIGGAYIVEMWSICPFLGIGSLGLATDFSMINYSNGPHNQHQTPLLPIYTTTMTMNESQQS